MFSISKNTRNDETCRQLDALFYPIMSGSLSADRLTSWNVLKCEMESQLGVGEREKWSQYRTSQ